LIIFCLCCENVWSEKELWKKKLEKVVKELEKNWKSFRKEIRKSCERKRKELEKIWKRN